MMLLSSIVGEIGIVHLISRSVLGQSRSYMSRERCLDGRAWGIEIALVIAIMVPLK